MKIEEELKEEPKVEAPTEAPVEEAEEEVSDDAKEKKLIDKITKSLAEEMANSRKADKEAEVKKEVLNTPTASFAKTKYTVHEFVGKKAGEKFEMPLAEAKECVRWFKAFLRKDYSEMRDSIQKLEPLNETTAGDGGNLVPTVLANFLTEVRDDIAVIRPRARYWDMSGMKTNQLDISGIATKPIGGYREELAEKGTSSVTFSQISLTPYSYATIVPMSTELRDDSPFDVVGLVGRLLGEAIAKDEDAYFINGTGTGQPTGLETYTLSAVNAGGAGTFDHIIQAYYLLPQPFRQNAYWITNSRVLENIRKLKDTTNDYILKPFGFITEPNMPAMLGRPVLENNNVGNGKIFFGDLKSYHVADKGGVQIDISDQATIGTGSNAYNLWQRNMLGVRAEIRNDGELAPTQAFVEIASF